MLQQHRSFNMSWTKFLNGADENLLDDAGCDMILTCIATVRFDARCRCCRANPQLVPAGGCISDQVAGQLRSDVGKPTCAKDKTDKARSRQAGLLSHKDPSAMTSLTI